MKHVWSSRPRFTKYYSLNGATSTTWKANLEQGLTILLANIYVLYLYRPTVLARRVCWSFLMCQVNLLQVWLTARGSSFTTPKHFDRMTPVSWNWDLNTPTRWRCRRDFRSGNLSVTASLNARAWWVTLDTVRWHHCYRCRRSVVSIRLSVRLYVLKVKRGLWPYTIRSNVNLATVQ